MLEPARQVVERPSGDNVPGKNPVAATAPEEPEKGPAVTPNYKANFPGLIDLVESKGECKFLMLEDGMPTLRQQVVEGLETYLAPPIKKVPWLLPRAKEVIKNFRSLNGLFGKSEQEELFEDIVEYLKSVSEMPSPAHYDLLAAWCIHTHLIDHFQYSPIIWLFAVPERGKSRTGKGLLYISRRGLHLETLREPFLIRASENYQSTAFFDIADVMRTLEKTQSQDIVLNRYERGLKVPKVNHPDRGAFNDTDFYEVFGATVIGSNEPVGPALESRTVTINMPSAKKEFENMVTPEGGRELMERLVALRAKFMGTPLPTVTKPAKGRAGDILKPLLQVMALLAPDRVKDFEDLVTRMLTAKKFEKSEGFDARILRSVSKLELFVLNGYLPVKTVTDSMNQDQLQRFHVSPHRVGRALTALGFDKGKTPNGSAAMLWDQKLLERLLRDHGLSPDSPETPAPQKTFKLKVVKSGQTGVTGVSKKKGGRMKSAA